MKLEEKEIKDCTNELKEQLEYIKELLAKVEQRMKTSEGVDDNIIRISYKKNGFQYYVVNEEGKRVYVKTDELDKVRRIIQKDYDKKVHDSLVTAKYRIERFLKLYDINTIEDVYNGLTEARKVMVDPIISTDEEFIKQWYEDNKGNMNPYTIQDAYYTDRGEVVRSKSEKIFADLFNKFGIPYSYEPMLRLNERSILYPDFVLLNVKTRETIFWEHFGLSADGEYAVRTLQKLALYEKAGMEIGRNLLFSIESEASPLNTREIEKKIKKYLM